MNKQRIQTRTIAGVAILTAVVIILQLLGQFVRFGPFSVSLVLVPIVVGAALYGIWAGAWLGFVFGMVVLFQPDTGAFLTVNPLATIAVVLLKGTLAGLCSGLVYKALAKVDMQILFTYKGKEKWGAELAVLAAAIVCPLVNTGIFLLGCWLFFIPTISEWAATAHMENVWTFIIVGMVGANFLFEVLFNFILSPVIVRLIKIGRHHEQHS